MSNRILCPLLCLIAVNASGNDLNPLSVRAAAAYSASHNGTSFLVIQRRRTLLEEYPAGGSAQTARKIYSGTKAFWNLAALAAAEDGLLNLDEHVADTIPTWRNNPQKAQVTIRQLLDFSAGLAPAFFLHNNDPGDRDSIAAKLPMVAKPGTTFIYGPSGLQVFHRVLENKLQKKSPARYLERRVL